MAKGRGPSRSSNRRVEDARRGRKAYRRPKEAGILRHTFLREYRASDMRKPKGGWF